MAQLANVTNNVFDSILPTIGNPRVKLPIWNEDFASQTGWQ